MKKLGFHFQGAAHIDSSGKIWTRGDMGILVDGYAGYFERIWLFLHEVENRSERGENRTDYCIKNTNVGVWSLGRPGHARDYLKRRKFIRQRLKGCNAGTIDVLLCREPSRRGKLLRRYLKNIDIRVLLCGDWRLASQQMPLWSSMGIFVRIRAIIQECSIKSFALQGKLMVNSPVLKQKYNKKGISVQETRTGILSEKYYQSKSKQPLVPPWQLLFVGRISREKGLWELLEACDLLRRKSFPFVLVLVGEVIGDDRTIFDTHMRDIGLAANIRLVGLIEPGPDLWQFYSYSHVLVFPSHFESLPRAVGEAMGLSLPVVATPVGALPLMFEHENDLLFTPVKDAPRLANAIERACTDKALRARIAANAYKKALGFTLEKNVCRTVEIINGNPVKDCHATL